MNNIIKLLQAFLFSTGFISCDHGISNALLEINTADSATIIYYERPPDNRFFKVVKGKKITDLKSVTEDVPATGNLLPKTTVKRMNLELDPVSLDM